MLQYTTGIGRIYNASIYKQIFYLLIFLNDSFTLFGVIKI